MRQIVRQCWPLMFVAVMGLMASSTVAAAKLKPFVLGSSGAGTVEDKVAEVKGALTGQGFEIAGDYAPYAGAHVVVVTSGELKSAAAKSDFGGYGAVQRVSVTQAGDQVQVAYTNPVYWAAAYRMKADLSGVASKLSAALGKVKDFGCEDKCRSDKELRGYHYKVFMPYFDDPDELASYGSFDEAVAKVEAGLAAGKGGTSKVYRVDIPGKKEAVFGVAMTEGFSSGEKIMGLIDGAEVKHTAHLPYELLVSGDKVYALNGKFRIAISFLDLSMMGKGSFMEIMDSPGAIAKALKAAAGG